MVAGVPAKQIEVGAVVEGVLTVEQIEHELVALAPYVSRMAQVEFFAEASPPF